jgi:hypothetical protein
MVPSPYKKYIQKHLLEDIEVLKEQLVKEKKYELILELQGRIIGLKRSLVILDEVDIFFQERFTVE